MGLKIYIKSDWMQTPNHNYKKKIVDCKTLLIIKNIFKVTIIKTFVQTYKVKL